MVLLPVKGLKGKHDKKSSPIFMSLSCSMCACIPQNKNYHQKTFHLGNMGS